jgi:hypothetical protein
MINWPYPTNMKGTRIKLNEGIFINTPSALQEVFNKKKQS